MLQTVFFDSDALIAGSASRSGASFLLLQLCELGLLKGITSQVVIKECTKNIGKKLPGAVPVFNKIVDKSLEIVSSPSLESLQRVKHMAHSKDLPILAAAVQSGADYLITFNIKHFQLDPNCTLKVSKPGDLVKRIRVLLNKKVN